MAAAGVPLGEGLAIFWRHRAFYGRFAAIGLTAIVQQGLPLWYPSILIRVHGMSMAETGFKLGAVSIIAGTIGTWIGPSIARAFERRGHADGAWRTAWIAMALAALVCLCVPIARSERRCWRSPRASCS